MIHVLTLNTNEEGRGYTGYGKWEIIRGERWEEEKGANPNRQNKFRKMR